MGVGSVPLPADLPKDALRGVTRLTSLFDRLDNQVRDFSALTPKRAINTVGNGMDLAMTVNGQIVHDSLAAFKLTDEENAQVASILNGRGSDGLPYDASQATPKAQYIASMVQGTNDHAFSMASSLGVINMYRDNYFTRLVRMPKEYMNKVPSKPGMYTLKPKVLNDISRFSKGRKVDDMSLDEFADYMGQNYPGAEVVRDPAVVAQAHLQSLGIATNHAALIKFLRSVDNPDAPGVKQILTDAERGKIRKKAEENGVEDPTASYIRAGDIIPDSWSKYEYAGKTNAEGPTVVNRRGYVKSPQTGEDTVLGEHALTWVHPDMYDGLKQFLEDSRQQTLPGWQDIWKNYNSWTVAWKLMNPLIHGMNAFSETMDSLPRHIFDSPSPKDWGENAQQWWKAWQDSRAIQNDPNKLANWLETHPSVAPITQRIAKDLADATGPIVQRTTLPPGVADVWNGAKNAVDGLRTANHKLLFEKIIQQDIIRETALNEAKGMEPDAASALASIKYTGIKPSELNKVQRWISSNAVFAGPWTNGTMAQIASLIPGGKGAEAFKAVTGMDKYFEGDLQTQIKKSLMTDFLAGQALNFGLLTLANRVFGNQWPWQNDPGHLLDIYTGQQDKNGNKIYLTSGLFRRQQDFLRLLAVPHVTTGYNQALGTNTIAELYGKAAPGVSTAAELVKGSQYISADNSDVGPLRTGPPIIGLTDTQKQGSTPTGGKLGEVYNEPVFSKQGAEQFGAFVLDHLLTPQVSSQVATRTADTQEPMAAPQVEAQLPGGVTWGERTGLTPPNITESPFGGAAGAISATLGMRTGAGARYTDQEARLLDEAKKYYNPDTVAWAANPDIGRTQELTYEPPAIGKSAMTTPMTPADKDLYMQKKAAWVDSRIKAQGAGFIKQIQDARAKVDAASTPAEKLAAQRSLTATETTVKNEIDKIFSTAKNIAGAAVYSTLTPEQRQQRVTSANQ